MSLDRAVELLQQENTLEANKQAMINFIPYLKAGAGGKKPAKDKTCIRHIYCYRQLLKYWNPNKELMAASKDDIVHLMAKIESQPLSEGTKAKVRLILKMLFRYYLGDNEIYPKQVAWIRTTDRSQTPVDENNMLSQQEILAMIRAATNLRDAAVLALLAEGLRPHELLLLKRKDVDINSEIPHAFIPENTKHGKRTEILGFSVAYLSQYFNALALNPDDPLFLYNLTDKSKGGLTYVALRKMFKGCAYRAGIKRRVWLYLARHSSITSDIRRGIPTHIVAKKHGTSPRMIEEKYAHITSGDVDNAYMNSNGLKVKPKVEEPVNIACSRCNAICPAQQVNCWRCGMPLSKTLAQQLLEKQQIMANLNSPELVEEFVHQYLLAQHARMKKRGRHSKATL